MTFELQDKAYGAPLNPGSSDLEETRPGEGRSERPQQAHEGRAAPMTSSSESPSLPGLWLFREKPQKTQLSPHLSSWGAWWRYQDMKLCIPEELAFPRAFKQ